MITEQEYGYMAYSSATDRVVPESTWFTLSDVTLRTVMAITLTALAASLFLATSGMHELTFGPVALMGAIVVAGFALVTLFQYFEVEGLPLIE